MDFVAYRRYEALSCQDHYTWQLKRIHHLHVFEKDGFPVYMESIDDLKGILDTMHETRLALFSRELGGLAEEDIESLRAALQILCDFFARMFSSPRCIVPLSTLLAHHVISRNLQGYIRHMGIKQPRILEIGPGCGYLSFFLKQWSELGHYAQIEACPSFYVLQHWVNKLLFGPQFVEHANPEQGCSAACPAAAYLDRAGGFESPRLLELRTAPICSHYPWWKIGDVRSQRFDIVASNANLNEFSAEAFIQYAQLAHTVLDDQGIFYAQCFGGWHLPGEGFAEMLQRIFSYFYQLGFAPVTVHLAPGRLDNGRLPDDSTPLAEYPFCLRKAVLVKAGHPLYGQCRQWIGTVPVLPELPILREMFRANRPGSGRMYSKDDLLRCLLPVGAHLEAVGS